MRNPIRPHAAVCAVVALTCGAFVSGVQATRDRRPAATAIGTQDEQPPRVERLPGNPIIRPEMLPGTDGENINGPSLIRVPDWLEQPLGRYYLYFSHHGGQYIRLAYADALAGPWRIHARGTLHLRDVPAASGHVASPDVIVDDERREFRLYVHGPAVAAPGQKTFVAVSKDGLDFRASDEILGLFYMRIFRWGGWWYGMAKGGLLHRSRDGLTLFEQGPNPFPGSELRDAEYNDHGPRHVALHLVGNRLRVYYTSIGDAPERIFRTSLDLSHDWTTWRTSPPVEVLRPEFEYEGVALPVQPSKAGAGKAREHALRDPAIFEDADGRVYLVYAVAGESGLAIAELHEPPARPVEQPERQRLH